jgi:hypothetical protein
MHRILLLALICLLLSVTSGFANDDDDSSFFFKIIFEEGFEGSFPPSGWKLESEDGSGWRRVTPGSEEGWDSYEGIRSACVGGDGDGILDERLITKRIDIAEETVGFDAQDLTFTLMAYSPDSGSLNQLRVEASTDSPEEGNWIPLNRDFDSTGDDDDSDDDLDMTAWLFADVGIQSYIEAESIWLAFRYTGSGSEMVCIDGLYLRLQGEYSDDEGCGGCGLGGRKPTVPLVGIMLLAGLIGLALSRRPN